MHMFYSAYCRRVVAVGINFGLLLLVVLHAAAADGQSTTTQKNLSGPRSAAATNRPNILIIMPDDVGYWNVGA